MKKETSNINTRRLNFAAYCQPIYSKNSVTFQNPPKMVF